MPVRTGAFWIPLNHLCSAVPINLVSKGICFRTLASPLLPPSGLFLRTSGRSAAPGQCPAGSSAPFILLSVAAWAWEGLIPERPAAPSLHSVPSVRGPLGSVAPRGPSPHHTPVPTGLTSFLTERFVYVFVLLRLRSLQGSCVEK